MPDTPEETHEAVSALCNDGFTGGEARLGRARQDPKHDVRLAEAAKEAAGECEIMIDAGLGYGDDAKVAIDVARELEQLGIFWLEEPFEPDEYEAYAELADASTSASRPASRTRPSGASAS
jgi:L-alanine-DL-glutamate epimerase-like enolase superfamily enzyme